MVMLAVFLVGCVTSTGPLYEDLRSNTPDSFEATWALATHADTVDTYVSIAREDGRKTMRFDDNGTGYGNTAGYVEQYNDTHVLSCTGRGTRDLLRAGEVYKFNKLDCDYARPDNIIGWDILSLPRLENITYQGKPNVSGRDCHEYAGDLPRSNRLLQQYSARYDEGTGEATVCLTDNGIPVHVEYRAIQDMGAPEEQTVRELTLDTFNATPSSASFKPPQTFTLTGRWLEFTTRNKLYFEILPLNTGDFNAWTGSNTTPAYAKTVSLEKHNRTVIEVPDRSKGIRPAVCINGDCQHGVDMLNEMSTCLGLNKTSCKATNYCTMKDYCQPKSQEQ